MAMSRLIRQPAPTVTARDGEEGLGYLLTQRFDVLLTDLRMPVMDGFELLQHCLKLPECHRPSASSRSAANTRPARSTATGAIPRQAVQPRHAPRHAEREAELRVQSLEFGHFKCQLDAQPVKLTITRPVNGSAAAFAPGGSTAAAQFRNSATLPLSRLHFHEILHARQILQHLRRGAARWRRRLDRASGGPCSGTCSQIRPPRAARGGSAISPREPRSARRSPKSRMNSRSIVFLAAWRLIVLFEWSPESGARFER